MALVAMGTDGLLGNVVVRVAVPLDPTEPDADGVLQRVDAVPASTVPEAVQA